MGALPTPPHNPLRWGSQEEDEEQQLLLDFLGGNAAYIATLNSEQRKEALIQARTKQFADKYARHRAAWERQRSPPGFWRADMPTTQEDKQDKEEAARIERERIEDRWREARRPGGRWIFRDE
jgi:hypothetical protein